MSQLNGKQVKNDSLSLSKLSGDGTAIIKVGGAITFNSGSTLKYEGTPQSADDVVNKAYVDAVASGLENVASKGLSEGYAGLDANGKVPLSQISDALLGNLKWYGLFNGTVISESPSPVLNGQALPAPSVGNVGWYFIAEGDFIRNTIEYRTGDWLISNGITYAKVDNTDAVSSVAGLVGNVSVENLRIALGNVTSVSIQNEAGIEQFEMTDLLKFKGVSFNAGQKRIEIDALVPLSAFLDIVNGNDATASLENSAKPFKTIQALLNTLPITSGETYIIYIYGGIVPVIRRMPSRNLKFFAYSATILDFTNCLEDDGITSATYCLTNTGFNGIWSFENNNISIKCDQPTLIKMFSYSDTHTDSVSILGALDKLQWYGKNNGNNGGFCMALGSDVKVNEVYNSNSNNILISILGDIYIKRLICLGVSTTTVFYKAYSVLIDSVECGNYTVNFTNSSGTSEIRDLKVKNIISLNKSVGFGIRTKKLTFIDSIITNAIIDVSFDGIVSGLIQSMIGTSTISSTPYSGTLRFIGFTGRIEKMLLFQNTKVSLENSNITVPKSFTIRSTGAQANTFLKCVSILGFNTINQLDTSFNLFGEGNSGLPIEIDIFGSLYTNAKTYGENISYNQNLGTFKEKLKEIVVRSKKDLVNRVLDSEMNYIVDGTITLLPTESIIVPVGGLSISGYGFDISAIKATGNNSTIFTSPVEGSGNLFTQNISIEASGTGSKVFNLINAGVETGGADAIELGVVNFDNCTSLGTLKNFRQGLWDNIGVFGCKDGLTFEGVWSGGFRADLVIVRNFGTSGVGGTLFKAGADLLFKSRVLSDINADFKVSGNLSDFTSANFNTTKLYQIKAAQVTRANVLDDTQNYTGTLNAFSPECDWSGNNGMKNSNIHPYGISTDKLLVFANDVDAGSGGVAIGEVYIEASTGYFKTRLT